MRRLELRNAGERDAAPAPDLLRRGGPGPARRRMRAIPAFNKLFIESEFVPELNLLSFAADLVPAKKSPSLWGTCW